MTIPDVIHSHTVMSTDDMMSPINVNTNNLKLIQGIIVENLDGEGSLNSPSTLPSAPGQRCASPHTLDARSVVWWSVELNLGARSSTGRDGSFLLAGVYSQCDSELE